MLEFIDNAKRYLRHFVELGFLVLLALILIYLILGDSSGDFVKSVADNVAKFTAAVTAPGLIGIAIVIGLVYVIAPRWTETGENPPRSSRPRR
jgi:hypothetical protein